MRLHYLIFIVCTFWGVSTKAFELSGVVKDEKGYPVPYVIVYKQNSSLATTSNIKGEYNIALPEGQHTIAFQALGFEKKKIEVSIEGASLVRNVRLQPAITQLNEVSVNADDYNKANRIIKKAISVREKYRSPAGTYSCTVYNKASVQLEKLKKDTSTAEDGSYTVTYSTNKDQINMIETVSEYYRSGNNQSKEIKKAVRNFADHHALTQKVTASIKIFRDVGPDQDVSINKDLFKTNLNDADFNFYYNLIRIPSLGPQPFVSPLSTGAMLSYKFTFDELFLEDGVWVNKITVIPRRKDAALFSGEIFIVDSTWNIKAINLTADNSNLHYYKNFNVIQRYAEVADGVWALDEETFSYNAKVNKKTVYGSTYIDYKDYNLDIDIDNKFFNNEVSRINDDAYEKDSTFWNQERTVKLSREELELIEVQQGLKDYESTVEYKDKMDSITNVYKWHEALFGADFSHHKTGVTYSLPGIVSSLNPFGVGGFRVRPEGSYKKEFQKGYHLKLSGMLNYGFNNKDLKGEGTIDYRYAPKRFGRVYLKYADEYGFLNSYESISRTFSMSNYVQQNTYGIGHEIEIVNGVYLDVFTELVKKRPITNIEFSQWSQDVFGADNEAPTFTPTNLALIDINLKYTFKQKYRIEPYKKINLGSKYPTIILNYRKGIPGVYDSQANFDFLQVQISDDIKLGTAGISKWKVYTGKYLNNQSILLTENKFFRGSDPFFFSNPLRSFQLLGPSLNTNNEFLQAHYFHRFNGAILNKIPLIKKLHLMEVGGAGVLLLKDDSYRHAEMYAGIERAFKIKRTQFKLGAYYVVSDDNLSSLNGELKFGIDFFNAFTNSWSY